ncbi:ArsB/NhaD family transporter, partial [Janibacter corallicola]|uniref:ArsB/NhaD family transporter n=1 Tax=Janibacter corallicola TaxID=415212 RepID=UPI00248088BD
AGRHDPVLLRVAAVVCLAAGPLFAVGVTPWLVSSLGAALLALVVWIRAPELLHRLSPPWGMAVVVMVLFGVVQVALSLGGQGVLDALAGTGEGPVGLLRVAGVGAVTGNVVNNLPAFIALEPVAGDGPGRLVALLIGTNVAPVITPWGSLATLLWLHRVRAAAVPVTGRAVLAQGATVAVVAGGGAVTALVLVA